MTETTDSLDMTAPPFRAAMRHDWVDVTMIHFGLPADVVRGLTPCEVDVFPGQGAARDPQAEDGPLAWVTLVMFELRAMRVPLGRCPIAEPVTRALLRPTSDHRFVNLRTYVRHRGRPGICFIAEWLNNRLAVTLGPTTFGLPYRFAPIIGPGRVVARDGTLAWTVDNPAMSPGLCPGALDGVRETGPRAEPGAHGEALVFTPAAPGSIDHFLLERYTAFTRLRGKPSCFHIRHAPWPIRRVGAAIDNDALLRAATGDWIDHTRTTLAHQSPGVFNVEVSRPFRIAPIHHPTLRPAPAKSTCMTPSQTGSRDATPPRPPGTRSVPAMAQNREQSF